MRSIALAISFLIAGAAGASAQPAPAPTVEPGIRGDVAVMYQFMHSNTQPGDCGCFNLNGAGISASWIFRPRLSAVVEGDAGFASNGPGTGSTITMASGLGGIRYGLPGLLRGSRAPRLFAEALAGGGHASGGIAGAAAGTYAFVGRVGGGFDEPLTNRLNVRVEAGYAPSTFANGINDRQNNVLIGAGIVYRWSYLK